MYAELGSGGVQPLLSHSISFCYLGTRLHPRRAGVRDLPCLFILSCNQTSVFVDVTDRYYIRTHCSFGYGMDHCAMGTVFSASLCSIYDMCDNRVLLRSKICLSCLGSKSGDLDAVAHVHARIPWAKFSLLSFNGCEVRSECSWVLSPTEFELLSRPEL